MKLSAAIQQLQSLLIEHGDLELKSELVIDNKKYCYLEPIFLLNSVNTVIIKETPQTKGNLSPVTGLNHEEEGSQSCLGDSGIEGRLGSY